ncbi:hypothetical protein V9T40_007477 [Parthenolecanium corni]|uniref:Group XIIA secretory phospholipase A2 n=1 Tax=Parthenolecanium corni TaxID=536013 RepID=A0AAN9TH48_9HEMI
MATPRLFRLIWLAIICFASASYSSLGLGLGRASANDDADFFSTTANVNSFFSSVFHTLLNLTKTIDAAIEEDCIYTCPAGQKPVPNRYHVPRSNGCGVAELRIPKYIPINRFEKCCDEHDICYATCNEKQQFCDAKLKKCLYGICASLEKYLSVDFLKGCKLVAKTMHTAVTAMGCKYYLDAQNEACICHENFHDEF